MLVTRLDERLLARLELEDVRIAARVQEYAQELARVGVVVDDEDGAAVGCHEAAITF